MINIAQSIWDGAWVILIVDPFFTLQIKKSIFNICIVGKTLFVSPGLLPHAGKLDWSVLPIGEISD